MKYRLYYPEEKGIPTKFVTGTQALVLVTLMQRARDKYFGKNTAGFVSGYRGSPLAGLDKAYMGAKSYLDDMQVVFHPGLNEDLAATSLWGSQQTNLFSGARYDGVFGLWYGKGPGVDRTGDVFKHANAAGTSQLGGVLAVAGDDHNCKSSIIPHQSEFAFRSALMPVLAPSNVQDVVDYALFGWELSRYSGCWVGLKVVADIADSSGSVHANPYIHMIRPDGLILPKEGLSIRHPDNPMEQEIRLKTIRLPAAKTFAQANNLNRMTHDSLNPRIGIVTSGKSYTDVCEALMLLGLTEHHLRHIGIRIFKVGMTWPLEIESMQKFLVRGLSHILVIEEKLNIIEDQLKSLLYNGVFHNIPIIGKTDAEGKPYLSETGELSSAAVALAIADQIPKWFRTEELEARVRHLRERQAAEFCASPIALKRVPYFCSGCPHNTSTKVPEGSRAGAGIGCHYMGTWMDRNIDTVTQMGGEGAQWIGQAPFTETKHIFQNLGDGTYFHSGSLAIRAAVAGKVNITFKILYNDAVAMTGGQPIDGKLSVPQVTHMVYHEGVQRIAVVSDDIEKYIGHRKEFADGVTIHHRDSLDALQKELRKFIGVSVLVYDQTCAAEKRRRRKQGKLPDLMKRIVINDRVCEGCGDCGEVSNCLSVEPIETAYGRKRTINQSSCNKDLSCVQGFCPSFVTVIPGKRKKGPNKTKEVNKISLPPPVPKPLHYPYNILITGVGGTGVITIAQILCWAAHRSGLVAVGLDMTGMSQKYGGVLSHVRIGHRLSIPNAVRVPHGETHLLLGCDLVGSSTAETLAHTSRGITHAVINDHEAPTAAFVSDPDLRFPTKEMKAEITASLGTEHVLYHDATRDTLKYFGDTVAANMYLLGMAYQRGLIPLAAIAIEEVIDLNGVDVELNRNAFHLGRQAVLPKGTTPADVPKETSDDMPSWLRYANELTRYQNGSYAHAYLSFLERVTEAEEHIMPGKKLLYEAVASAYYKLLAYKDEYEIARLFTDGKFLDRLNNEYEGITRLEFHMAPPIFPGRDKVTGSPKKRIFGPWILTAMRFLAKAKFLRGTRFDPFGYTAERKEERQLIAEYEGMIRDVCVKLTPVNYRLAVELAKLPEKIRGYGHVKNAAISAYQKHRGVLLARFEGKKLSAKTILESIPIVAK
jgi:indolepyruvate ferredoxin oxidoreductase